MSKRTNQIDALIASLIGQPGVQPWMFAHLYDVRTQIEEIEKSGERLRAAIEAEKAA